MEALDREYLRGLLDRARRPRPPHWQLWTLDGLSFPIGLLPPQRLVELARAMPTHMPLLPDGEHWVWHAAHCTAAERSAVLQEFAKAQRAKGLLRGWRDEAYACWGWRDDAWPYPEPALFHLERAAFRHLGLRSHASHVHGITANGRMWCGRRAWDKATDPGMLDNLAAGGLPAGEVPEQCALREILEEAGLDRSPRDLRGQTREVVTEREEAEGWHSERLFLYSVVVAEDERPANRDGEVMEYLCLSYPDVLRRMRAGEFTVDAACAMARSWLRGDLFTTG